MCFPFIAPMQWGKIHTLSKELLMCLHSSLVFGVCKYSEERASNKVLTITFLSPKTKALNENLKKKKTNSFKLLKTSFETLYQPLRRIRDNQKQNKTVIDNCWQQAKMSAEKT